VETGAFDAFGTLCVTGISVDDGGGVEEKSVLEEDSWDGIWGILLLLTSSSSMLILSTFSLQQVCDGDSTVFFSAQHTPKRNPSAQVPNLLPPSLMHS
jgi:hypothetical protein